MSPGRTRIASERAPRAEKPRQTSTDERFCITEKDWRQVVVDYARIRGWLCYFTWRSIHSPAGFPDLVLVRNGRLIAAELKTERGRLGPSQREWLLALDGVPSVETATWRPSDWPAVRDALL